MEPYSSDDIKRKKRKNSHGLDRLLGAIPEVTSVLIVSTEGLPIAYALPQDTDETRIAAMTSALLSLSEKVIIEMGKGDFDQLYIKGSEGYLLVMQAGPNMVLLVSTTKDVRLGLILLDCRRACEKISQLLDDFDNDDDDKYPYPYIFTHPRPPDDFAGAAQVQVRAPFLREKEPEGENNCQYCGMKLTKEEQFTHSCKKKPKT